MSKTTTGNCTCSTCGVTYTFGDGLGYCRQFCGAFCHGRAVGRKENMYAPEVQREYTCGCKSCVCEDPVQCQGCGSRHCGTHKGPPDPLSLWAVRKPATKEPKPMTDEDFERESEMRGESREERMGGGL